ncbi:MAG: hypothetical protein DHS20C05_06350 [Hyphococcus sp.]|nr:MAG: hypothetical protein DHS20C05_06350 [Marinicaulis sp.]
MEADFLNTLLQITIAISVAIVVTLLLRRSVRTRLGARNAYALWAIVPFAAAAVLLPARRIIETLPDNTLIDTLAAPLPRGPIIQPEITEVAAPAMSALNTSAMEWDTVFCFIWGIGLISALGLLVWRQRRFLKKLGELERSTYDGVSVYKTNAVGIGPALVGAFQPRLIVPADFEQRYTPKERALVLAHEHVHLSRRDVQINGLVAVLGCIFWFNPLFAFAAIRMREDQEMACDAEVLAQKTSARGDYARALFKTQLFSGAVPMGCAWPSAGAHPLRTRMTALTHKKNSQISERIGAFVIVCIVLIGGTFAWAMQPPVVSVVMDDTSPMTLSSPTPSSAPTAPTPSVRSNTTDASASYIDRLASAGLKNLTVDQLIALKVHNVGVEEIKSARQLGFDPTPDNLVAMAVANVTPAFVASVRAQGWQDVSVHELVSMQHMGVDPADAKKFEALGLEDMSIQQLTSFAAMNVTVDYVRSLQAAGITEKNPDAYARALAMGITPEFIAEARRRGFDELTLDKLARLKSVNIF